MNDYEFAAGIEAGKYLGSSHELTTKPKGGEKLGDL